MSSSKVNTWSTKCQSFNGLKVTLVKKRKSSPEQEDVGDGSAEETKQNQTMASGGPRWTIESNKNPCKLVIKRRKTVEFPDSSKETCSSGEPDLKMRIVASTKTSQDSDATFMRVKNWCKQQISNSVSVVGYDNYLASDLQCSQPSPKCSGLESCLPAELFHLQPSPKDSGIDVSSPPRRLDEIHLADGGSCVAMATISESTTVTNVTSMVVSDVVLAMFSNAECANQDSMHHAVKCNVDKSVLKTGKARVCGEVMNQVSGRTTRRLSNLQSLCSYGSAKLSSAPEEDRIMLRLPSSMFQASVAGVVRNKTVSASSIAAGHSSGKLLGPVTFADTLTSDPSALDITDKTGNCNETGQFLTSVTNSKDPAGPKVIGATESENPTGPTYAQKVKSTTKSGLVVGKDVNAKDPGITGQVENLDKTGPVMVASGSAFSEEKSKFQISPSFTGENENKICRNITLKKRSKNQIDTSITKVNKRKDQIDPSVTQEHRSKNQIDPSVTQEHRSKNQIDPSVTQEHRSKNQIDPSISGEKRSKDHVGPNFTGKSGRKTKICQNITTEKRRKDQNDPSITDENRGKDQIDRSITQEQRSKDHVGPSITGKKRSKDHVGPSITEKKRRKDRGGPSITEKKRNKGQVGPSIAGDIRSQEQIDPAATSATSIEDQACQRHTERTRSKNRTSSTVSGEMKTKSKPCSSISEEMNSKASADPSSDDETRSKKQFNASTVTVMQSREDPGCPRGKKQSGPKSVREIRNKNQSGPVVTEETRNKKNANGSALKRELKSRNQICPVVTRDMNAMDVDSPFNSEEMKSQNQTSPVDTPQMSSKLQASSGCSSMTSNDQFELGCALENQTIAHAASKLSTEEIQGCDVVVANSLKKQYSTEACELIPERQPKRNSSALQARKWRAGSRNSASRRSYDRLCHATEIPPPLLTIASSDPLRITENSVKSRQTNTLLSMPPLLSEEWQSDLEAACTKVEHSKTVTKPSTVGDGLTKRDQQLSSLYDFEDDSPPVLEFNKTSVNGRSIFPHRSRLPWKERCVDILASTSGSVNSSSDQDVLKSVSLMPNLVPLGLQETVDFPLLEANGFRSESDDLPKTLTKSTGNYMGEFAKFVSGQQLSKNEAEEHTVILSASNVVQEAEIDQMERSSLKAKQNKSLPENGAVTVANDTRSFHSSTSKNMVKPGGRNAMAKRKRLSKPTLYDLQTKSQLNISSDLRGVFPEISQDDESSLSTSKEKCMENESPKSDDATVVDCNTFTDKLQIITYHKSVSEDMSETSENSIEPEQFDFSLFISEQKSLACLRDKVAILLRTVFPGVVNFCDNANVPVVYKFLDQLVDEMMCNKAGDKSVNRIEMCCCDCEVSLCRTPKRCLGVFQRKVLELLRILLPTADLGNIETGEIEPLVDAVTWANASQLGQEHCRSEEFSDSELCGLGDSRILEMVNTNGEECCCHDLCFHSSRNCQRVLCCHGVEHSHDNLNFGSDIQHSAILASTCNEDLLLKSEDICVNR